MNDNYERAREKYERFLGRPHYLSSPEIIDSLQTSGNLPKKLSELFLDAYFEQLRSLGFCYFGVREVEHYYHLIFATRDKKGKEFWDKCQKIEFSGQRTLF